MYIYIAEKAGYKREDILKHVTQDKFTPLHAAIGSGELDVSYMLIMLHPCTNLIPIIQMSLFSNSKNPEL